jgi:hypothetical protein
MLRLRRYNRPTALLLTVALIFMLGIALGACTRPKEPATPAPEPTVSPEPEPEGPAEETSFNVYLVRDERLGVGLRTVPRTVAVAEAALQGLLGGPTAEEAEAGLSTQIPEGTRLLGVEITDAVATVNLSGEFESGGGSLSMQVRVAQVVFTLTQFDTVDRVAFMIDGAPAEAIGGEGIIVSPRSVVWTSRTIPRPQSSSSRPHPGKT